MSNYTVDFRHEDRTGHNVTRQDKNALHIALHVTQKCVAHLLLSCVTHQLNNLISVDLLIFTLKIVKSRLLFLASLLNETVKIRTEIEKQFVDVIYDRRKLAAKRGNGYVEVRVYLGRNERKYFPMGMATPDEWEALASSEAVTQLLHKCKKIVTAMEVLGEEMTMENFNLHYFGEDALKKEEENKAKEPDNSKKNFITYMELTLEGEQLRHGTYKHKKCLIAAVRAFGKLNTYGDLTSRNIIAFDKWLHDGTRSDVTCYDYHKRLHKWVRQLFQMGEIKKDPYDSVTIKRGKCKEREPLTETELKLMRSYKFEGKLARVRDLFIFAAYTGLSFCDTQNFDFESMTKKEGDLYYIDGSRIKTETKFFTPILSPAMKVLEKYKYQLPKISNQKAK